MEKILYMSYNIDNFVLEKKFTNQLSSLN